MPDSPRPSSPAGALNADSIVVATRDQLSSRMADETVILHLSGGTYYGLDGVGTAIWGLLQEPRTVAEIRDRLLDEYDVGAERCERAVLSLLEDLTARGLVEARAS